MRRSGDRRGLGRLVVRLAARPAPLSLVASTLQRLAGCDSAVSIGTGDFAGLGRSHGHAGVGRQVVAGQFDLASRVRPARPAGNTPVTTGNSPADSR